MVSKTKPNLFSKLPDCLLVLIISFLPFKQSVQTSLLAKRWKNLCRETPNLVFKESEFLNQSVVHTETKMSETRALFVSIMHQWISKFTGDTIETFELCLPEPVGFEEDIMSLIEFAATKQTKNLVIDFSSPNSREPVGALHIMIMKYYQNNVLDITRLFFNLIYVRNLTICPFLLEMIQDCDDPMKLHDPMKTRHLVIKTYMYAHEFPGMTILLNSCPKLESLTFDTDTTGPIVISCMLFAQTLLKRRSPPIDPKTFWFNNKTYECLERTLKVVKINNFRGNSNELHVLRYLIRTGRVMERLDLYEAKGLNNNKRMLLLAAAEEVRNVKKASRHLRITLHNA